MSACIVLAPVLISTWPMFAAAIASASASAGFRLVRDKKETAANVALPSLEITMDNMEVVAESLTHDKDITVERDGVRVTFSRDARGYFKTCVEVIATRRN